MSVLGVLGSSLVWILRGQTWVWLHRRLCLSGGAGFLSPTHGSSTTTAASGSTPGRSIVLGDGESVCLGWESGILVRNNSTVGWLLILGGFCREWMSGLGSLHGADASALGSPACSKGRAAAPATSWTRTTSPSRRRTMAWPPRPSRHRAATPSSSGRTAWPCPPSPR